MGGRGNRPRSGPCPGIPRPRIRGMGRCAACCPGHPVLSFFLRQKGPASARTLLVHPLRGSRSHANPCAAVGGLVRWRGDLPDRRRSLELRWRFLAGVSAAVCSRREARRRSGWSCSSASCCACDRSGGSGIRSAPRQPPDRRKSGCHGTRLGRRSDGHLRGPGDGSFVRGPAPDGRLGQLSSPPVCLGSLADGQTGREPGSGVVVSAERVYENALPLRPGVGWPGFRLGNPGHPTQRRCAFFSPEGATVHSPGRQPWEPGRRRACARFAVPGLTPWAMHCRPGLKDRVRVDALDRNPAEPVQVGRDEIGIRHDDQMELVRPDVPTRGGKHRIQGDGRQAFGQAAVLVGRQSVQKQTGVAGDQGRRGLEMTRLALDQGAAGIRELVPGRRARRASPGFPVAGRPAPGPGGSTGGTRTPRTAPPRVESRTRYARRRYSPSPRGAGGSDAR